MALQSLHEMIRNLSTYIKSLETLCECGVTLSKNFERLLAQPLGGGGNVAGASSSSGLGTIDGDTLSQAVATWELAQKVATTDTHSLISELLPLLQETVQNVMKDPSTIQSSSTYEVFRSCFSAFFQIQWRFCQLYLSCASSQTSSHGGLLRSPETHLARSPTFASFSSSSMSADRRESTESCMSAFSLPRSSISGLSSISSRSSSPLPGLGHHHHHYGFGGRSRTSSIFESSPSVKFTPSQPPSPMMPYGEGFQPNLFRRWSAYSNASSGSGHSVGSSFTGMGSYGSSSGNGASLSSPMSYSSMTFSRRWSVPASVSQQSSDSGKKSEPADIDYGLINAINLLSTKPPTPTNLLTLEESRSEYAELESDEPQTTSLWPPSDTMPGVVLTTCGTDPDATGVMEALQSSSHTSLRVPFPAPGIDPTFGLGSTSPPGTRLTPTPPSGSSSGIGSASGSLFPSQISRTPGSAGTGEYSLFGSTSTTTSGP